MEKQTLGEIASQKLLEMIQRDGYTAGDKLPTEAELDDPLGFAMIEDRRKLTEDLIQVRVMLEPPIAALAAQNATVEDIRQLENILLGLEEQMILREDYADKDSQFHAQIANCSHNLVMTNLVPVITDGVRVFAGAVQETEYEQTLKSHRRIFEAIRDRKPVEAQQAMYFHLMYNDNRYKGEMGDGKQGMKGTRAKEQ